MTKEESNAQQSTQEDDDEPDEWDKRIFSTGCAGESCFSYKTQWQNTKEDMELYEVL